MLTLLNAAVLTSLGLIAEQHRPLSGGLMLFAVVVGLVLAIAFQVVLASLGAAMGLSLAHPLFAQRDAPKEDAEPISYEADADSSDRPAFEGSAPNAQPPSEPEELKSNQGQLLSAVGVIAGLSLLLTVDTVLFGACFLAVRFSQLAQPLPGIILGLAIWAMYLLLLLTLGSSALGSTTEFLLGGALSNLRRLLNLVKQVLQAPAEPARASDPEQSFSQLKSQLTALQGELTLLSDSVLSVNRAAVDRAESGDFEQREHDSKPTSQLLESSHLSSSPTHSGSTHSSLEIAETIAEPEPQPNLKTAAVALASTAASSMTAAARTTVADSWQQVQEQVRHQADATTTSLLSSLNESLQAQAQQVLNQANLSDWSLEQLWARIYESGRAPISAVTEPAVIEQNARADAETAVASKSAQLGNANSDKLQREVSQRAIQPMEIAQINLDFRNYLKYTSLKKLNLAALEQKLDELLALLPQSLLTQAAATTSTSPTSTRQSVQHSSEQSPFELAEWKQALLSRKGIKASQLQRYMAAIEAKVLPIAIPMQSTSIESTEADLQENSLPDINLSELEQQLAPLLGQLTVEKLSLEDFKQLVINLKRGGFSLSKRLNSPTPNGSPLTSNSSNQPEQFKASGATATEKKVDEATASVEQQSSLPFYAPQGDDYDSALSELKERAQTLVAELDSNLQQGIEAFSTLLPSIGHPLQSLRDRLPSLSDRLVIQLADLPNGPGEQLQAWIEQTHTQLAEQIHQTQVALEDSLEMARSQALRQADQVRHWAAVAAWWLFGLMLSSAIAAGAAGYYAVSSPWLRSF